MGVLAHSHHELIATDTDSHVAPHHEGNATEHLSLGDIGTVTDAGPNIVGQSLVVPHVRADGREELGPSAACPRLELGNDLRMDTSRAKERLTEELDELKVVLEQRRDSGDLDESQQESSGELSSQDQHPGDVGTTTFERTRDLAIEKHLEDRIEEVGAALARIDGGSYGKCEVCGKDIEPERLEARPATRYCKEHQEEVEDDLS